MEAKSTGMVQDQKGLAICCALCLSQYRLYLLNCSPLTSVVINFDHRLCGAR